MELLGLCAAHCDPVPRCGSQQAGGGDQAAEHGDWKTRAIPRPTRRRSSRQEAESMLLSTMAKKSCGCQVSAERRKRRGTGLSILHKSVSGREIAGKKREIAGKKTTAACVLPRCGRRKGQAQTEPSRIKTTS